MKCEKINVKELKKLKDFMCECEEISNSEFDLLVKGVIEINESNVDNDGMYNESISYLNIVIEEIEEELDREYDRNDEERNAELHLNALNLAKDLYKISLLGTLNY